MGVLGHNFSACPAGLGGISLFEEQAERSLVKRLNFGPEGLDVMNKTRFKKIKHYMPYAFYDNNAPDDPYHPIKLLYDGFNNNRKRTVASSILTVIDESMSSFQPRTSKTGALHGGLPNISYIIRKPRPLGCEFKVSKIFKIQYLLVQLRP